jgi:hypothetical protein
MRARNACVRQGEPNMVNIIEVSRALRVELSGAAGSVRPQRGPTGRISARNSASRHAARRRTEAVRRLLEAVQTLNMDEFSL